MIGVQIKNGFLDFAKTDFECPHCKAKYSDADDKYLKRCEKNKTGKMFTEFLNEIGCKIDVVDFFLITQLKNRNGNNCNWIDLWNTMGIS